MGRSNASRKGRSKRQSILDASAKVLAEKGYANTTLQDVADEIGIYAASIYYYFPSRDDLISEVAFAALERFEDTIETELEDLPSDFSPLERVGAAIGSMVRIYTSQDVYLIAYERLIGQVPEALAIKLNERRKVIRKLWSALLEDAQKAGQLSASMDLRLLRFIILGATQWITQWYDVNGNDSPDEIARVFTKVLLHGAAYDPNFTE